MTSEQVPSTQLNQPDPSWYKLVEVDQRTLFGYVDMNLWDTTMDMIPLPDRKHWLEVHKINDHNAEVLVNLWAYTEEEADKERVTICIGCGQLVSAGQSVKEKLCPDCIQFGTPTCSKT